MIDDSSTDDPELRSPWIRTGPDERLTAEIEHTNAGRLQLTIRRDETTVLDPSPMGIVAEQAAFTEGLTVLNRTDRVDEGRYDLLYGKRATREYRAREMTLSCGTDSGDSLEVDVWVSTEGVAYRYRVPDSHGVTVRSEASGFQLPSGAEVWTAPFADRGDYEGIYRQTTPEEMDGEYQFPTLYGTDDEWVLLTEAAVDRQYCGTRLDTRSGRTELYVEFPPETTPDTDGQLVTPWRVAVVGGLDTIVESDVVLDVSPGNRLSDTSWIEPGRAAWAWLTGPSPDDFEGQKRYVDYAAEHGWEFVTVDDGWDEAWIQELVAYAAERGVDIVIWTYWTEGHDGSVGFAASGEGLDDPKAREELLAHWADWGVAGLKVDFLEEGGEDQERMAYYDDLLDAAADHELLINLHGSSLPRGRRRRWPHYITSEAVHGREHGELPTAHQTALPFTRNVVGPMDFTPVAFENSGTPPGHELALAIVYESGQQHFAGDHDRYETMPGVQRLLDAVPAAWDDIRFVDGSPGSEATLARRSGSDWFVGSIIAGDRREVVVSLGFLNDGVPYAAEIVRDDSAGDRLVHEWDVVDTTDELRFELPADGGVSVHLWADETPSPPPVIDS